VPDRGVDLAGDVWDLDGMFASGAERWRRERVVAATGCPEWKSGLRPFCLATWYDEPSMPLAAEPGRSIFEPWSDPGRLSILPRVGSGATGVLAYFHKPSRESAAGVNEPSGRPVSVCSIPSAFHAVVGRGLERSRLSTKQVV